MLVTSLHVRPPLAEAKRATTKVANYDPLALVPTYVDSGADKYAYNGGYTLRATRVWMTLPRSIG